MEEDKKTTVSVIPDIITPASNALQANVPETMKQADGALSSIVGLFNNVVFEILWIISYIKSMGRI